MSPIFCTNAASFRLFVKHSFSTSNLFTIFIKFLVDLVNYWSVCKTWIYIIIIDQYDIYRKTTNQMSNDYDTSVCHMPPSSSPIIIFDINDIQQSLPNESESIKRWLMYSFLWWLFVKSLYSKQTQLIASFIQSFHISTSCYFHFNISSLLVHTITGTSKLRNTSLWNWPCQTSLIHNMLFTNRECSKQSTTLLTGNCDVFIFVKCAFI